MRVFRVAILFSLMAFVAGCQTKGGTDGKPAEPAMVAKADTKADTKAAPADATPAPKADCGCDKKAKADCAQAKTAGKKLPCGADATAAHDHVGHDDHAGHDHAGGGAVNPQRALDEKLGTALAGAEAVDLAKLVGDPAAFDGKTVTLTGEVTDMCHHRRGWFAIASPDGKKMVRVITGPGKFQVPQGAMGSTAKAEGAVKVITLDEKQIAYYRRSHKFISDEELRAGGPIKQAILMASGAEFKR